jgi:hypothetical protein
MGVERGRSISYLPKRCSSWDILFNSPSSSSSSSSLVPSQSGDLPLCNIENSLNVFSASYPKMHKAIKIKLPFAMSIQRHPDLIPSRLEWTQRQRAIISKIVDMPSNQANTVNQLERLVRNYGSFSFLIVLTLYFPDRSIFQEQRSPRG